MNLVKRWYEAWNAHDVKAILKLFSEDGVVHDVLVGRDLGINEIGGYAENVFVALPDLVFIVDSEIEAPPEASITIWRGLGTHTGPFGALAPTGRKVNVGGVDVFRCRADKLHNVRVVWDTRPFFEQLGVLPELKL